MSWKARAHIIKIYKPKEKSPEKEKADGGDSTGGIFSPGVRVSRYIHV